MLALKILGSIFLILVSLLLYEFYFPFYVCGFFFSICRPAFLLKYTCLLGLRVFGGSYDIFNFCSFPSPFMGFVV